MPMEQTVKERLIQFIKYKGLSQRKFEIEVGLSNGYINNIRNGIEVSVLQKLLCNRQGKRACLRFCETIMKQKSEIVRNNLNYFRYISFVKRLKTNQ